MTFRCSPRRSQCESTSSVRSPNFRAKSTRSRPRRPVIRLSRTKRRCKKPGFHRDIHLRHRERSRIQLKFLFICQGILREFKLGDLQFNYGCLPRTWEDPNTPHPDTGFKGDDDPIDVCEIGLRPIPTGSIRSVKARILELLGLSLSPSPVGSSHLMICPPPPIYRCSECWR